MSQMPLYFLNTQKKLTAHYEWLQINLTDTYELVKRLMPIPSLDVVVKVGKLVLPEKGHHGFYPEAGVVYRNSSSRKSIILQKLCALHCSNVCT
ncbi:Uncharacterised protein [Escherichia coli]|nr:Uncharacterised protein [Escherichia coli]